MNEDQKAQVEDNVRNHAKAFGLTITEWEWNPADGADKQRSIGHPGSGSPTYSLRVTIGEKRDVLTFTVHEVEDCNRSGLQGMTARQRMRQKIDEFLEAFAPQQNPMRFRPI